MNVVLYLRYSSDRQTEQSIEGQRRICEEFCRREGYDIITEYVDRATSAAKDIEKRTSFLRMIKDSEKRKFEGVVVYKLDRFARDRYDSASYKRKLRQNGVRVISATERISADPEGVLLESVLEGLAEFYSKELSQKITRGMRESAMKCQTTGGNGLLGYVTKNKKYVIDEAEAAIVREAFELYAVGYKAKDIVKIFNEKGYRSKRGAKFTGTTLQHILHNERYTGVYIYDDIRVEGGMPAIVSRDLFDRCQSRAEMYRKGPGYAKADEPYILKGQIRCGHCGGGICSDSGRSGIGRKYRYYNCDARKKQNACDKKQMRKELLEDAVIHDILDELTPDMIEAIAEKTETVYADRRHMDAELPVLKNQLEEVNAKIRNIVKMIEKGMDSDELIDRMTELNGEKKGIEHRIASLENSCEVISKEQVTAWLNKFIHGDIEDLYFRMKLVEYLVSSVTVWDDGENLVIETILNTTGRPLRSVAGKDRTREKLDDGDRIYAEGLFALRKEHRNYAGKGSASA